MSGDFVTKNDLDKVETKLGRRIDGVETKLGQRIDGVETKLGQRIDGVETKLGQRIDKVDANLDIVARHVGSLTTRVNTLTTQVNTLTTQVNTLTTRVDTIASTMVTRDHLEAKLAAFRGEVNRDIAQHIEAGFERMHELFAVQDDRAKSIEEKHGALRRDFTEHARDMTLHNPS